MVEAIKNLYPIAVASLFPLSNPAHAAAADAHVPLIEIELLPALGDPHLAAGALRVDHLVSRGHHQLAFAYRYRPLDRPVLSLNAKSPPEKSWAEPNLFSAKAQTA